VRLIDSGQIEEREIELRKRDSRGESLPGGKADNTRTVS